MANINLYSDRHMSATSVSNIFIDEYMSDANGEFVKIYLYLLRQLNAPDSVFSLSAIADKFEHTEKDVKRALSYWERMQLLRLDYDESENLNGIHLLDTHSKKAGVPVQPQNTGTAESAPAKKDTAPPPKKDAAAEKKAYSADDIRQFREQETIAELLFITERYLGRMLTPTDLNLILYWYDGLKFSAELIEYLIEHCVSKGHKSIRYIDKVALAWAAEQIQTVEQAKAAAGQYSKSCFVVMKAMGITGRSLVTSETAFIEKWKSEYGFSLEMIAAACERTLSSIHQPSFEYTDTILSNWKKNQVKTLEDAAKSDDAFQKKKKTSAAGARNVSKNKFNNFDQRSYDYDQMEKMLLTTSLQKLREEPTCL